MKKTLLFLLVFGSLHLLGQEPSRRYRDTFMKRIKRIETTSESNKINNFSNQITSSNVWVVAVGIGNYQHDDILTDLDYTIQGAYEFTRIFEGRQLIANKPSVLINSRATRSRIIKAMKSTFVDNPKMTKDDMILFYFSGHGETINRQIGICPYDYTGAVRDLITDDTIQYILKSSRAKHKVCFIEACKTEAQSAGLINPVILENFNKQRRNIDGGMAYITSTEAGKKSWGNREIGGYFTHYLIRGLEGKANVNQDAYITVKELFDYVQTGVKDYSKQKQIPQINRKGYDTQMPLMVIPEKIVDLTPPNEYPSKRIPRKQPITFAPINEYPPGFEYLAEDMILVEGGKFKMGDIFKEGYHDENPVHKVTVPTFYINRYEVTNEQFCMFLNEIGNQKEKGKRWLNLENNFFCKIELINDVFYPKKGLENHPVVEVSWYGAKAYCQWLSNKTGKSFKLPSEAIWEYAAREGGRKVRFGNGKNIADFEEMNFDEEDKNRHTYRFNRTVPVHTLSSNALALYNMSGNVREWCRDTYLDKYTNAPINGMAWDEKNQGIKVVRGGSWSTSAYFCRVTARNACNANPSNYQLSDIGFRLSQY